MAAIRKRFGQHFLERAWIDKVVRAIDPSRDEVFLEIGPGRGAITGPLAARSKHVLAVEIDRDLVRELRAASPENVTIIDGDFLDISAARLVDELRSVGGHPTRVVGNLPYNVASPILFRLVELFGGGVALVDATIMLQREVADRLTAKPGTKEYGVLGVLIGHSAAAERVLTLPPGAFRPPPRVTSALVRLRFHAPTPPVRSQAAFGALVQTVFTRRRKTLANALRACVPPQGQSPANLLMQAGLDGRRRPETLTIAEFARLSDALPPTCV